MGDYAFYRIPNMLTQFSILKNSFTVFSTTGVNDACKIKLFLIIEQRYNTRGFQILQFQPDIIDVVGACWR